MPSRKEEKTQRRNKNVVQIFGMLWWVPPAMTATRTAILVEQLILKATSFGNLVKSAPVNPARASEVVATYRLLSFFVLTYMP